MNKNPLISIIVPIYNSEKYLSRCIECIQNQTYKNLEILLIDDESSDNSPEICDEYAQRDVRIKVYHKKNSGTGPTRQFGFEHSHGEYIAFVDNDDIVKPEMYETMLKAIQDSGADVCACQFNHILADGTAEWNGDDLNPLILGVHDSLEFCRYYYDGGYSNGVVGSIWNKLFSCHYLNNIKMRNGRGEEEEVNDYVFRNQCKVVVIEEELYYWMENVESVSHRPFNEKNFHFLDVIRQRAAWLSKDKYVKNMSMKLFCNLYVEYYYAAKRNSVLIPPPIAQTFPKFIFNLCIARCCELKFYTRMLVFLISPLLYKKIILRNG